LSIESIGEKLEETRAWNKRKDHEEDRFIRPKNTAKPVQKWRHIDRAYVSNKNSFVVLFDETRIKQDLVDHEKRI